MHSPADPDIFRIPVGPGAVHVGRFGYGGAPVVLVHGFGTSSFLWRQVGPMLAVRRLSAFAIDLFGYGESDRPFDADFGLHAQAEYLDAALTALQLPHATIVAMDLGGAIALRLAFDRPERISKLVLIGIPPLDDLPGAEIRELQRDTARYALRLSRGLFGVSALLTPFLEDSVIDRRRMPPALIGRYLAPYLGRDGANHLVALSGAFSEEELEDLDLSTIRQETLLIRGAGDGWCTREVAEGVAARLPFARCVDVDDAGRLVPEDAPEALATLLADFVRGESTGEPARVPLESHVREAQGGTFAPRRA